MIYWTPRVIAATLGGYYGLGIAYESGWMALIDRIAIQIIKRYFGYAGIGALMPAVQWHAAWIARISIGCGVGIIYDLSARFALYLKEPSSEKLRAVYRS